MGGILRALGCSAYLSLWWEVGALWVERLAVLFPPFPLLSTVYQCDGCLSSQGRGAHGWFVRFCQLSVQSPSWSWLPIVVASGCLRHTTSTESVSATKLVILIFFYCADYWLSVPCSQVPITSRFGCNIKYTASPFSSFSTTEVVRSKTS